MICSELAEFVQEGSPAFVAIQGDITFALMHPYTNRLIHESSPYLLQHAHNPVDWYPWSE